MQILSYDVGQYCKPHLDSKRWLADTAAGFRILTVLLYLTAAEIGGETAFPDLGLTVAPRSGAAVIWPGVLDRNPDELDGRLIHEGLVVKKGVKMAANVWVHMYDVDVAERW